VFVAVPENLDLNREKSHHLSIRDALDVLVRRSSNFGCQLGIWAAKSCDWLLGRTEFSITTHRCGVPSTPAGGAGARPR
jgi:hypothetical protein